MVRDRVAECGAWRPNNDKHSRIVAVCGTLEDRRVAGSSLRPGRRPVTRDSQVPAVHPALEESSGRTLENRLRFTDSPSMRQTAAPWSSLDARDQWGIQFPLLPEELDELVQPTSSSLAQVISSWRLSIAAAWPAPHDALDQWGIEFQIPDGELANLARHRRRGRLRGISQAGALAAILAIVVAGSALAVNPLASAGAAPPDGAPTGGQPVVNRGADSALSTISNATLGPTPGATPSAETIAITPVSNIPASAVPEARPSQVGLIAVPTIQDARSYLVARLGAKVDRHWGIAQSQCASLIYEYEARWNPHATNKTSGAYGLPQAHPASKLANWAEAKARAADEAGDAEAAWLYRAWRDNPVVQAEWGVDYMIQRYGSPCAALAFRSGYWEDNGVFVPGVGWY